MGMSVDDYYLALLHLLPPGKAFPRNDAGVMRDTLKAMAEAFALVDLRIDNLIDEADPRTTLELLADWERVCALDELETVALRQLAVADKITDIGGQSRAFFIAVALKFGFVITITEFRPYTCISTVDQGIYEDDCRFVWQVNAPATTVTEATCQSPCTEPLRVWGNEILEALINYRKPAHTTAIFAYGG
jgi:uncharacterized protein YmfQ (DUF2313 family)